MSTKPVNRPRPTVAVEGGLSVIGAGFGRTGTSSLQQALEILGFGPCYHMREVFKDPEGLAKWNRIGTRTAGDTTTNWDDIFFGYKATTDVPAAMYYKELCAYYPNAKVILTVRDEEKWVTSAMQTIIPCSPLWKVLHSLALTENHSFARMLSNVVWKPFCGGESSARDRDALLAAFRMHNEAVQTTVPPEKLLVFDVKNGWGDLCKFLDRPIPDAPFPRAWEAAEFKAMIQARKKKTIIRLVGAGAILGLIGAAVFRGWKRPK
jgi:hypothetical protein